MGWGLLRCHELNHRSPFLPLLSLKPPHPRFWCLRGPGVQKGVGQSCPQQLSDLLPGGHRMNTTASGSTVFKPLESEDEDETSFGIPDTTYSETTQPPYVQREQGRRLSKAGVTLQR